MDPITIELNKAELKTLSQSSLLKSSIGYTSRAKSSGQTFVPKSNSKSSRLGYISEGIQVIYSRKVHRITLTRAIVSKIVFSKEKVELREILVLFDNMLWLQDKAAQDDGFQRKFGNSLEVLSSILKKSRIGSNLSKKAMTNMSNSFLHFLEPFLIPERNLKNVLKQLSGKYETRLGKQPGISNKKLPEKRRIGVGYRDKGTARDLAIDGTPTWQEYARMRLWK